MPDKLIPGKKRTMAYKKGRAKSSAFQMKGNPFKNKNKGLSKEAQNLLKAVPNQEAFDNLTPRERKSFLVAADKYGIPTTTEKKSPAPKASPAKGGWWAKQTKTHGGPSRVLNFNPRKTLGLG